LTDTDQTRHGNTHGEGRVFRSATPLHLHKCVARFVSDSCFLFSCCLWQWWQRQCELCEDVSVVLGWPVVSWAVWHAGSPLLFATKFRIYRTQRENNSATFYCVVFLSTSQGRFRVEHDGQFEAGWALPTTLDSGMTEPIHSADDWVTEQTDRAIDGHTSVTHCSTDTFVFHRETFWLVSFKQRAAAGLVRTRLKLRRPSQGLSVLKITGNNHRR